jgi:hypothetical protein
MHACCRNPKFDMFFGEKHDTRQGHYAPLPRSTEPTARTTPTFLNQKRSTLVREESQFGWSSKQRLQCQRSPGPPSRGHNPNLGLSRGWANLLHRAPATVAGLAAQSCDRSPLRQLRRSLAARIARLGRRREGSLSFRAASAGTGSLLKCSLGSEEPDTANGVAFQQLADAPTQHGTNQDVGVED